MSEGEPNVEVDQKEYAKGLSDISADGVPEGAVTDAPPPPTTTTPPNTNSIDFEFVDHFSLKQPSSSVRSRGVTTRVYDLANDQLQLEHQIVVSDKNKNLQVQLTMQRLRGGNLGLRILRSMYTLVALLMAGFTFVLTCNIILMQAMEIPRNSGQAAGYALNVPIFIANILSLPMLVYSMASVMVFASVFVTDTWNGHVLFSLLVGTRVPHVYVEWYCFVLYLGVPLAAYVIVALMGKDNWQEIGGLVWYACFTISFIIFSALVFYREMALSLDLARILCSSEDAGSTPTTGEVVKQAVLATLSQRYSGREERQYLTRENVQDPKASVASSDNIKPLRTYQSIYSRTTTLSFNPFFENVLPPQRRYSVEEIRETVPIVTHQSWSLPKMCCSWGSGRSKFAVSGPNALDSSQFLSTLVCTVVGVTLGLFMVASFVYGFGQGTVVIVAAVLVGFFCWGAPCIWSAIQFYNAMPEDRTQEDDEMPVYQAWSSFTVAKPKEWYCWFRLCMTFAVLFVLPLVALFADRLFRLAVLFLVTTFFTMARQFLDAGSILSEHYSLSKVSFPGTDDQDNMTQQSKTNAMVARARASEVIGKITNSARIWFWIAVFTIMGAYFIYSGVNSAGSGEDYNTQTGREPIRFLNDFYYPRQNDSMLYPNCQLTNQYAFPGIDNTYVTDYNLLAGLAYETPEVNKYALDRWFLGENRVVDETEFVKQWRTDSGNSDSQVSFKVFSFPSSPGVGILSIRGTETPLDALFNIQLYCGTVLTMVVRYAMPFSWLWDSIYDDLVATTTWVASEHLQQSEYYRVTTDFVNEVLGGYSVNGTGFNWLRSTGVSLGGGLALITGAQTDVSNNKIERNLAEDAHI